MADVYGVDVTTQTINDMRHRFVDPIYAGDEAVVPMAANAVIAAEQFVCANASGYAVAGADTSGYKFLGIAMEAKDNTGGANGAKLIRIRRRGCFLMAASSIAQSNVGSVMEIVNATTFDDTSTNHVKCGKLIKYVSATAGWIAINEGF